MSETKFCPDHVTVVGFFAEWCGHCKHFKPEYDKAIIEMKDSSEHMHVFEDRRTMTDSEKKEMQTLMSTLKVTGFPTVIINTPNKGLSRYNGERNKDALIKYIKSQ